ncbi:MAG TPA: hypothetical protein VMP01_24555 [Pirellulaceae bacterium]|nr:hypothetical protein [Pirellulaceae bacterium]
MTRPLVPYRPPPAESEPPPVVARVIDDSPEDFQLKPVDCPSRHELAGPTFPLELPSPQPAPDASSRFRFSVLDLLVVTTAISVGLAGGKWIAAEVFALIMGVVTLGGLILVELYPPQSRAGWLAWIALVLVYLSAWLSALAANS